MVGAIERERKFLVPPAQVAAVATGAPTRIAQAYVRVSAECEHRIRLVGDSYTYCIKVGGPTLSRREEEFAIDDPELGAAVFDDAPYRVTKDRFSVVVDEQSFWDVDVFLGDNAGLVIAEIELSEDLARVSVPEWCEREVTGVPSFYNSYLARHPVSTWSSSVLAQFGIVR